MSVRRLGILVAVIGGVAASLEPALLQPSPGQDAGRAAFSAGRYERAFALLRPRAEAGEASAQFLVGLMLRDGLGVPRDIAEAKRWLTLAAGQDYEGARFVLGEIELVDGAASASAGAAGPLPQPQPERESVADTRVAPLNPTPSGPPSPKPTPRAEPGIRSPEPLPSPAGPLTGRAYWLEMAAKQGTASAQYDLARLFESGRGAPRDMSRALAWYREAAEQGHVSAQVQLGYLLAASEAVPRDLVEASRWYRAAAEAGDTRARFSLAILLGAGEDADRVEALVWLERALIDSSGSMRERIGRERDRLAGTLTPEQLLQVRERLAAR